VDLTPAMNDAFRTDAPRLLGSREERAPALQWVALFLAPATFFAHLQIAYVLVPWACVTRGHAWVHLSGLVAIALALAGAWAGWLVHARADNAQENDGAGAIPRTRFLGTVGLCTSGLFVLLLVAQWAAGFVISPCQ
jgi:hypothetical protein